MIKRYETYKNSGVSWLNQIPEHWKMVKFRYKLETTKGLTITKSNLLDKGVPCVNYGEIHSKYGFELNPEIHYLKYVSEEYLETNKGSLLSRGDFVFADTSEDIKGAGNFTHLNSDRPTFAGYHTIIARLIDNSDYRYVAYFFDSTTFRTQIQNLVKGVKVYSITNKILKDTILFCPLKEEQTQIANYLDHKTSLIDSIIAQKEQLIEQLNEQRQAIINEAVTKGLNPNTPLKNSGIEWLGEIPVHWEVIKLRYLADITTGDKDTENREDDAKYPFFVRSQTVERISTFSFNGEAILTAGDGVGVCKVWHYINGKFDYHQRVYMMHNFRKITGIYLFNFMKENFINEVLKLSAKSTVDSLRRPMFLDFPVAVPPIEEQSIIIDLLSSKQDSIDKSIDGIIVSIEKLKEYRQSIISEAVTGKIDVRDWKSKTT